MAKIKMFALGGLNETGKNMYVIEVNQDIFVFDAGLKYADDRMLGIDYIIPNYDYLVENKKRIKGIFLSHGHDEQIGAIPDMKEDLKGVKIYGTKFTLDMLKEDLDEYSDLVEIKPYKKINFGKCSVFPITLTHNVPDSVGFVLNTSDGAIVYTSNFAFDPSMLGHYKTDIGKLAYIGKQGVLCLLSESVLSYRRGYTTPSHRCFNYINEIINTYDKRILFNIYTGQINRIQEILKSVMETERNIVIIGKKLEQIIVNAIDNGYIEFDKSRIKNIHQVKEENIIVLISDEREKPFSNIKRIVNGYDKFTVLRNDDTIVFASPVYDGMEKTATMIFDEIAKKDINLITISAKEFPSLHASSEDLMLMLDLMKPKYYFPVIGEYRYQVDNANIAKQLGMSDENIILSLNGQVSIIENGILNPTKEDVNADEVLVDGKTVGDVSEVVIKDREMLGDNGIVLVIATIDKGTKKVLVGPEVISKGFIFGKDNIDLINEAAKMVSDIIKNNTKQYYIDYTRTRNEIRDKVGKYFYQQTECKPMVLIMLQEI